MKITDTLTRMIIDSKDIGKITKITMSEYVLRGIILENKRYVPTVSPDTFTLRGIPVEVVKNGVQINLTIEVNTDE